MGVVRNSTYHVEVVAVRELGISSPTQYNSGFYLLAIL